MLINSKGQLIAWSWTPEGMMQYETLRYNLEVLLTGYHVEKNMNKEQNIRFWLDGKLKIFETIEDLEKYNLNGNNKMKGYVT